MIYIYINIYIYYYIVCICILYVFICIHEHCHNQLHSISPIYTLYPRCNWSWSPCELIRLDIWPTSNPWFWWLSPYCWWLLAMLHPSSENIQMLGQMNQLTTLIFAVFGLFGLFGLFGWGWSTSRTVPPARLWPHASSRALVLTCLGVLREPLLSRLPSGGDFTGPAADFNSEAINDYIYIIIYIYI